MAQDNLIDFYPTPEALISKLTANLTWHRFGPILEPSAGKGNICDYVRDMVKHSTYYSNRHADIDVIEINPELQHILRGKEYRLVHNDFLTFQTWKHYDLIVANFPFGEGDKHLDRALRLIEQYGGILRCLVNAETLRNPFTNLRKSLVTKLEQFNAEVDYLAGEFESAERKTSVEVALIKVERDRPEPVSLILESLKIAPGATQGDFVPDEIVAADFLAAICALFDKECEGAVRLIEEFHAMKPYVKERLQKPGEDHDPGPVIRLKIGDKDAGRCIAEDVNGYLRKLRKKYWEALLHDERFTHQYTSNILKQLNEKLDELKGYDFTPFNIRELQKELNAKLVAGIEAAILELFDTLSRRYSYGENYGTNIHYFNGWKTNKAHYINHRVIIPLRLMSYYTPGSFDYDAHKVLTDMVKVFNYLSKDKVDAPQLVSGAMEGAKGDRRRRLSRELRLDLKYFSMRVFKGGTVHITFKDRDLLKKFNIYGCQKKKWLPPDYGKKRYAEMSQEERDAVDAFQGKEDYERVIKRREFFIVESLALREGLLFLSESTTDRQPEETVGPLPESIGDDGEIAVYEIIEPGPQEPTDDEEGYESPFSLAAEAFPAAPAVAVPLLELPARPAEPEETITKDEWFRHYRNGIGYVKQCARHIIRDHKRIPVTVEGMPSPRKK